MSKMIKDVLVLTRGSVLAQAIGFLMMPLLSRLYAPADFGTFGLYQAAILLISVLTCLRYDVAILTTPDKSEAVDLFKLCSVIVLGVTLLLVIPVFALSWATQTHNLLGSQSLFWLIPGAFLSGMTLAAGALLTRLGAFSTTASGKITQAATNSGVSVAAGLAWVSASGLVLADQAGKLAFLLSTIRKVLPKNPVTPGTRSLFALAKKYSDFPKLSVLGGLLNNGGSFITPVFLYYHFGSEVTGQYSLVDRAVSLPLGLVIVSINQVFSSQYAQLLRDDAQTASRYLAKLLRGLALLGLAPFLIGLLISPVVFPLVFGDHWATAGKYAQVLAPMYYSAVIVGPLNSALVIVGKLNWQLRWDAGRLIALMMLWLFVEAAQLKPIHALVGLASVMVFVNGVYVLLVWLQVKAAMNSASKEA